MAKNVYNWTWPSGQRNGYGKKSWVYYMNTIRGHTSEPFWIITKKTWLKRPMNKLENCKSKSTLEDIGFVDRKFDFFLVQNILVLFCTESLTLSKIFRKGPRAEHIVWKLIKVITITLFLKFEVCRFKPELFCLEADGK